MSAECHPPLRYLEPKSDLSPSCLVCFGGQIEPKTIVLRLAITRYSGLLSVRGGYLSSSTADASSSFFWKVVVLQDPSLLLSLFTYLLVGADLVESGPR